MAFFTIVVPPGLSKQDRRRAVRAGPPAVLSRRDQGSLLRTAGFTVADEIDVTADFLMTLRAWHREASCRADELRAVHGVQGFEDRQRDRSLGAAAAEAGVLRRSLFVTRRPLTPD